MVEGCVARCSPLGCQAIEGGDYVVGIDGAGDIDGQAFSAESSMTFNNLSIFPSAVCPNWKSKAHTTLGRMGQKAPTATPMPLKGRLFSGRAP